MPRRTVSRRTTVNRAQLTEAIGRAVTRFQDGSNAFDEVAAEILALERGDLAVMTQLLYRGSASAEELAAALHMKRGPVLVTLERLQLAGYARAQAGSRTRIELSDHARAWIERIWTPLWRKGAQVLDTYPVTELEPVARFILQACAIQDVRTRQLRTWLGSSPTTARRSHLRGGLSPAALRRVQLFVEGNLSGPIHLADMAARAGLSAYHFARAFRTSAGTTPRAFVEHRRIERAKTLLTQSTQSLADVAVEAGLGTQSRLTTTFKRRTGFTPGEFRRGGQ
jgi:AraC family transcriptional regulator